MITPPWYHASPHISVLYNEVIQALQPCNQGRYIDATLGVGGHAWGILQNSSPNGLLLGLDVDDQAIEIARKHLANFTGRVFIQKASYETIKEQITHLQWHQVNGIVIDLGVSSIQLDTPERGFSFQKEGPLDMRFDNQQKSSAEEIVNQLSESELSDLIWRYGDEIKHRKIAHAILQARPVKNTAELAEVIRKALPTKGHQRVHPATRTFQAIRIAVNQELAALENFLPQAIDVLAPGGRLAVISFHSLEDRIVKHFFRNESKDCICPPEQPICTCSHIASIRNLTPRPINPSQTEIENNSRARSAHLRIAEKI